MMDYREFVDQVTEDLKNVLSEEFRGTKITARQVDKLQGESYYGLCVQPVDSVIGVNMNLQGAYENYQTGVSYDEIIQEIAGVVEDGIGNRPNIKVNELTDYDAMRDKLMVQVVPTKGNEEMLAGIPHKEQEDLSLVYRFVFDNNAQGMASTLVNNQMLKQYDITAEQLHADAMTNAAEHFPAKIRSMQEVLSELMGIEADMMPVPDDAGMFIATCNNGLNGAGCIFYPEFMDQAAEKLNGDFFVLPSSVHEVILFPDDGEKNYHELESMVQQINETEVAPQDRLSDSVYHYDSQERIFEKAERFNERMQEKKAEKERPKEKGSLKARLDEKKKEATMIGAENKSSNRVLNAEL